MKHILIPTDFSSNAWNAIEYTMAFFAKAPIHVHLLHIANGATVEDDTDLHTHGISLTTVTTKSRKQKLRDLKQKIETLFPRGTYEIEIDVMKSFFIEGIKKAVVEKNIDLIIMGTKGASGLKEVTLGSHTGAVITRVKCPVFIIPENAEYHRPDNIVLPTDFNMLYKNRIMETLFEIADQHESSIKVLRVANEERPLNEEQEKNRNFLIDALGGREYSFHLVHSPRLEQGLQTFIDIMDIQVVAMIAKNLNFFQRLLLKPTAAKISYHTEVPFLVLHE